jgi:hypothetical protein
MNKAYLFAPVVALLLFIAVYWNFQSGYEAREAARQELIQAEKKAKLAAEVEARRQAVEDAVKAQEVRKKEREAREAADRARQQERQLVIDARDKAFREQEKNSRQLARLKEDLAAEKQALAKLTEARAALVAEETFLRDYVRKAEANVKALETVLQKIAQAEAARLAAAAKPTQS